MLIISLASMNPKKTSEANIKTKAEFVIDVTWPDNSKDDVDTYVEDSQGNLVYFHRKEDGLMHLTRDDTGYGTDKMRTEMGEVFVSNNNKEEVFIRGIVPGEYVVNVHMYHKRDPLPIEVVGKIDKLNPSKSVVAMKKVVLYKSGQEETICRFVVGSDGKIMDVYYLPKSLSQRTGYSSGYPTYPSPNSEDYE
jgi:hypothetical protein